MYATSCLLLGVQFADLYAEKLSKMVPTIQSSKHCSEWLQTRNDYTLQQKAQPQRRKPGMHCCIALKLCALQLVPGQRSSSPRPCAPLYSILHNYCQWRMVKTACLSVSNTSRFWERCLGTRRILSYLVKISGLRPLIIASMASVSLRTTLPFHLHPMAAPLVLRCRQTPRRLILLQTLGRQHLSKREIPRSSWNASCASSRRQMPLCLKEQNKC